MLGIFASEVRRDFREMVLDELEVMYGPAVRADAETALTDPERLDVVGVALRSGTPLVATQGAARRTAKWWAREVGVESADHAGR